MQTLAAQSALAVRFSALVHATQKERGLSSLFLGSHGAKASEDLRAQRAKTDQAIQDLAGRLGEAVWVARFVRFAPPGPLAETG